MIHSTEAKQGISEMVLPNTDSVHSVQDSFIQAWIEMAKCLGFTHTTAEVHALLYIHARPLCTDDVMGRLNMSRGNVSMCLRSLRDAGVVRRVHLAGVRKDYFESLENIWDIFTAIAENRLRAHINPALSEIRRCMARSAGAECGVASDRLSLAILRRRLDEMDRFIVSINKMSQQLAATQRLTPRKTNSSSGRAPGKARVRA
jgi:DNA-binding transcriptional regulator GbsR (MarR family)